MFLIIGAALIFVIWKREARWLAFTMIVSLFAYNVISMVSGVGRFPSIALVVFWSPLAVYLARRRSRLALTGRFDRIYSWWVTASLLTLLVSVAFDIYNVGYALTAQIP